MQNPHNTQKSQQTTHTLYILGNTYTAPAGFTVMTCMEYLGFRLTRGCGCRGAVCGACAILYGVGESPTWRVGLACQTLSQDHMTLAFLPHSRGQQGMYNAKNTPCTLEAIETIYPNLNRCIQCNTCTQSCPVGLKVLGYLLALRQGNFEKLLQLSMECILCGMCATRCPKDISPYGVALMVRRLYTQQKYTPTKDFTQSLTRAKQVHWQEELHNYKNMSQKEIMAIYKHFQSQKGAGVNE